MAPDPIAERVVVVTEMSVAHELYRLTGDRVPITMRIEWCDPMETCGGWAVLPAAAVEDIRPGDQLDLHLFPALATGGLLDPGQTVSIGEQ